MGSFKNLNCTGHIEAAFFEGYTHQELSDRFGVPLGTVKARIRTGLLTLRGHLAQAI